jgi:hypothetical protein
MSVIRSRISLAPLLPALALAALVLLTLGATAAAAATYGGLGNVGASTIKAGTGGKGHVDPTEGHNFAVDPSTGHFFIAEEFKEEAKTRVRVQAFGAKGEFLAENLITLATGRGSGLGGLAIDPGHKRLYMLETRVRPEESEAIELKIQKKEEQLEKAKKEGNTAEAEKLEAEIAKLEEEKLVFDPGINAASEIFSFSTEVATEKLKEQKVLTSAAVLNPASEEAKVSLIAPQGIAVDPKSHELVILGQQDESPRKGPGEEEPRAAVQRVHENGTLGPRYVDQVNCLDQGEPSATEPACATKSRAEFPRSPIVTPQGRVYVEVTQTAGEIWEMPGTPAGEEGFTTVPVQPKRIFTLSNEAEQQKLLEFRGQEEVPGTMAFVQTGEKEGKIFVVGTVEHEFRAVIELSYAESGGVATVTERGWTGGQGATSSQEKCVIPPTSTRAPLIGIGMGENTLVFEAQPEQSPAPAFAIVLGFGSGGEACGHPTLTPPSVQVGELKNAKEVATGQKTTISSQLAGANAKATKWKFASTAGEEPGPFEAGYQFESPSMEHEFTRLGEFTITETVETDNLGTPTVEAKLEHFKTTASAPKVKVLHTGGEPHAGEPVTLEGSVTDVNEATPHLKYTWKFGDGSAPVVEHEEATKPSVVRKVSHTFLSRCGGKCTVVLEVEDEAATGKPGSGKIELGIAPSRTEEEGAAAKHKAEEEAAVAKHKAEEEAAAAKHKAEVEAEEAATRALVAKHKVEEEEAAKQRVLNEKTVKNPEAKLAGTSLSVAPNGSVVVTVTCPTGETGCVGTLTLKTLTAVSAKAKKAILTLASGSFNVAGGGSSKVTLHLSGKAKTLLARSHTLRALAVTVAHDTAGVSRTVKTTVTLRLVKPRKKH